MTLNSVYTKNLTRSLFVNPVNALVVPFEALDVAQVEVTESKPPIAVVVCQSQ